MPHRIHVLMLNQSSYYHRRRRSSSQGLFGFGFGFGYWLMMLMSIFHGTSIIRRQRSFVSSLALSSSNKNNKSKKIAVVGGGASGIFASIAAAEHPNVDKVVVLEATSKTLSKVKISGGGRCNVLHDTTKTIPTILAGYPRGSKELNGLYHKRFTPTMARDWFECRGVELKTESDGRMFPTTDSSQTIIDTLLESSVQEGVEIRKKQKVVSIIYRQDGTFEIRYKDDNDEVEEYAAVILATGSAPSGLALAKSLGHNLVSPVPSLFTLNCKHDISQEDGLFFGLSGISVPFAKISLSKKQYQEGPLLITHHGISGPAVLKLSAFYSHEFHDMSYKGQVTIHWDTPLGLNEDKIFEQLWQITFSNPKKTISSVCPLPNSSIPRRLWSALVVKASGIDETTIWGNAPKKSIRKLAQNIVSCKVQITGKSTFKDEFVTAGGIPLKEIQMKNMESKICPGLFFCGEINNVDGITGGYNFMNCWSTGYVAGHGAADYLA